MALLRLKADWDSPVKPPRVADVGKLAPAPPASALRGHFTGRQQERDLLVNELLRRTQGSILVCGYRGVGKTSLVYQALHDVYEKARLSNSPRKNLYVLMNGAQLDPRTGEGTEIKARDIVVNLIRRLYTASRPETDGAAALSAPTTAAINELYLKAAAIEFSESQRSRASQEHLVERRTETTLGLSASRELTLGATWLASWLVAGGLLFAPIQEPLNEVLALFAAAPLPLTISFGLKRTWSKSATKTHSNEAATEYRFDNSLPNLEFDLEDVHRRLASDGVTTIYVVDELDKLDKQQVLEVFRFFKNLFTLSSAVFVFVGGEELHRHFSDESSPLPLAGPKGDGATDPAASGPPNSGQAIDSLTRPPEYTYFSSKYFLSRPRWEDLSDFLDDIVEVVPEESRDDYDMLKRLLVYEARSDFFDIIGRVTDRLSIVDEATPTIQLDTLQQDDLRRAKLQKAASVVFRGGHETPSPSRWTENEWVLRGLYELCHSLGNASPGFVFEDDRADTVAAEARRDLCRFLDRLGILNEVGPSTTEPIRGIEVAIHNWRYTGEFPDVVPDLVTIKSEFENRFIGVFETYAGRLLRLCSYHVALRRDPGVRISEFVESRVESLATEASDWGSEYLSTLNEFEPIFKLISTDGEPHEYGREDVENMIVRLTSSSDALVSGFPSLMSGLISSALRALDLQVDSLSNPEMLPSLENLRDQLARVPHAVVFRARPVKSLLIVGELDLDLLSKAKRRIRADHERILRLKPATEDSPASRGAVTEFYLSDDVDRYRNWAKKAQLFTPADERELIEGGKALHRWFLQESKT